MPSAKFLVTGGAGFIGSNLVHHLLGRDAESSVTVLDRLTYAGNLENLGTLTDDARFEFVQGDICDRELVRATIARIRPDVIFNLAAESHVDRSIESPSEFVRTNVLGTFEMLDAALGYFQGLGETTREKFRFVHVSTDEVFGSLGATGYFTESTAYAPNSPYSASKAGADHLVRAYFHTFGLPVITTNCSNNYGPYQFPEKLIPLVILNALENKPLPVYGDGRNVRDWLYVLDHCDGLVRASTHGQPGETYNLGGNSERTTLEVVQTVCAALDALSPRAAGQYEELIRFVTDRPGHDRRYAIDASKAAREIGWKPSTSFERGIHSTVEWYLGQRGWCQRIFDNTYGRERLGLQRKTGS